MCEKGNESVPEYLHDRDVMDCHEDECWNLRRTKSTLSKTDLTNSIRNETNFLGQEWVLD